VFIQNWKQYAGRGVQIGSPHAPVQVIEFADFECPFCRTFYETLKKLRERYPGRIALSYVHYPLPMHRFAVPAARVAECADEQNQFEAMQNQLFTGQQLFGLKPWLEFATEAGIPDLAAFEACTRREGQITRVVEGRRLGDEIGVRATPTLIINGWKLAYPPSEDQLDRMIIAILAGESPVAANGIPIQ
jgi:protein-disulfide isomerase